MILYFAIVVGSSDDMELKHLSRYLSGAFPKGIFRELQQKLEPPALRMVDSTYNEIIIFYRYCEVRI
jgi:hypothetical protein